MINSLAIAKGEIQFILINGKKYDVRNEQSLAEIGLKDFA